MDTIKISTLLSDKLAPLGYEVVSCKTHVEKGNNVLSVVVDRVEPIDMNAIVEVSGIISSYMDEIDNSETPYLLDVSSLGAEKPLKVDNLDKYVGRYVNVHLINPINGENIYEGDIVTVNEDSFTLRYRIKTRVKEIVILFNNIYKIRLAIKF